MRVAVVGLGLVMSRAVTPTYPQYAEPKMTFFAQCIGVC
jgi:hypothetical protein